MIQRLSAPPGCQWGLLGSHLLEQVKINASGQRASGPTLIFNRLTLISTTLKVWRCQTPKTYRSLIWICANRRNGRALIARRDSGCMLSLWLPTRTGENFVLVWMARANLHMWLSGQLFKHHVAFKLLWIPDRFFLSSVSGFLKWSPDFLQLACQQ